jgi:hypothetical protein
MSMTFFKTNIPVYDTAKLNVTTNQLIVPFDFIHGNDLYENDIDNEIHCIVKCKVNKWGWIQVLLWNVKKSLTLIKN